MKNFLSRPAHFYYAVPPQCGIMTIALYTRMKINEPKRAVVENCDLSSAGNSSIANWVRAIIRIKAILPALEKEIALNVLVTVCTKVPESYRPEQRDAIGELRE